MSKPSENSKLAFFDSIALFYFFNSLPHFYGVSSFLFFSRRFLKEASEEVESLRKWECQDPVVMEPQRVTKTQLSKFLDTCASKYMESVIEPGKFFPRKFRWKLFFLSF